MEWVDNVWAVRVLLLAVVCYFGAKGWEAVQNLRRTDRQMKLRSRAEASWTQVEGRVVKMGIGLDYEPPPDMAEAAEEEWDDMESRFMNAAERNLELNWRHGSVFIGYEYEWEGETRRGRRVSLLPGWTKEGDPWCMEYFYSIKVGQVVPVWVNPKRPSQTTLVQMEQPALDAWMGQMTYREGMPPLLRLAGSVVVFSISFLF